MNTLNFFKERERVHFFRTDFERELINSFSECSGFLFVL